MTPNENKPREFWIHTDCGEYGTEPSAHECDREFDIHVIEYSAYENLKKELDKNVCNSGHKTLPLRLWDCPECTEIRRKENQRLRGVLEQIRDCAPEVTGYSIDDLREIAEQALAEVCESLENLEGEICNHEDVLKDVGSWAPEKKRDFCSTCHQWVYRDWKNEATQALSKLEALVQALEGQKVKDK